MSEKLVDVYYSHTLVREPDGRYVLEVCCGSHAVYMVSVELTPDEIAAYHANPSSITALASEIQYHGKRPT